MSSNGADIAVAGLLLIRILEDIEKDERRLQRKRRYWTNPLLSKRLIDIETNLLSDLLYEDNTNHKNLLRLPYENFCEIHELVRPIIITEDTAMRVSITSKVRLAVTLRLLVTGDNYRSLGYLARISPSTISVFVPTVLKAIYQCLQPKFLKFPQNQEEWETVSMDFEKLWHFPHTLGALDGKHVRIKQPNSSRFYNYKGFHSIIVLALVDAHCKFIYIDVGSNGRSSGGEVFSASSLLNYMKSSKCCFPSPKPLPGQTSPIPYYIVADETFALDKNLMIPYSRYGQLSTLQEVFNYRLCRARLTVEAAFGRMASRFRILHRPIETKLDTIDWIIKCCCVLHNYLTIPGENTQAPENLQPDKLPKTITNIPAQNISSRYKNANKIRDGIALYCTKAGNVSFQWEKIKIKSFN